MDTVRGVTSRGAWGAAWRVVVVVGTLLVGDEVGIVVVGAVAGTLLVGGELEIVAV